MKYLISNSTVKVIASPSSRRAWIEIQEHTKTQKEVWSPSSRRAWIEITLVILHTIKINVALLAEGVD